MGTLSRGHYGLSRFPYDTLFVILLIGLVVALAALVAYGPM